MHRAWCQQKAFGHSDPARRIADTYSEHRIKGFYDSLGKWFAAALHDGSSDSVLYDTRRDAVRYQRNNEQLYTYICVGPADMWACEAEVMLRIARTAHDRGFRLTDPTHRTGGREIIRRIGAETQLALSRGYSINLNRSTV